MKLLKTLLGVLFVLNIKSFPFSYMVQFYLRVIYNLLLQYPKFKREGEANTFGITGKKNKLDVFEYTTFKTYVSPLEIDMYLHKSNSTYLIDLDLARTNVVTKVFQKLWFNYFNDVKGEFGKRSLSNMPYVPVATIQVTYKRELKLFQRYNIKSRILAWDDKWVFVLSKFVLPGSEKLIAIAVTKYVFKKKLRITIRPEEMVRECGLWNEEVAEQNRKNYEIVKYMSSSEDLEALAGSF